VPAGLVIATDIEVVKAMFAAFAARDLETVLTLADPDIEFTAVTGEHAGRTDPYRVHDGLRAYFRDVADVWEELRLTPREFRPAGDLVLVTGKVSALSGAYGHGLDRLDLAGPRREGRLRKGVRIGGGRGRRPRGLGTPLRSQQVVHLLLLAHDHVLEAVLDGLGGGLASGRLDGGLECL
jgi:ketosteroid isomerase-like protein